MINTLICEYKKKRPDIKRRLQDFRSVWQEGEKRIFSELCFCICTPQSKALLCDKAVRSLVKNGALFTGNLIEIRSGLKGVRFPNNKARFIAEAREFFSSGSGICIKDRIDISDIRGTRQWLVRNVKGIGLKEASHFLRNIGFGEDLAILDVHNIRNMIRFGVIEEKPVSLTNAKYMELEEKLRDFAEKIKIPMGDLDLLFWSRETGEIFK